MHLSTFATTKLLVVFTLLFGGLLPQLSCAQEVPTYDLRFVTAAVVDTTDGQDVLVFFRVSAEKARNYPPVISMRVAYSLDGGDLTMVSIGKNANVALVVFGRDIEKKSQLGYSLVKDKIDLADKAEFMLLAFYFKNVTRKPVADMMVRYGLWEKRNLEQRTEQDYTFKVLPFTP